METHDQILCEHYGRDEKVDISNHHYLTLSELNAWLATIAVSFARGVLLDYGCGRKPNYAFLQLVFLEYATLDAPDGQIISLWKKSPPQNALQ